METLPVGTKYLSAICHDIKSNTLEGTWIEVTNTELKRIKCRNYSAEQKEEFLSDCGADCQKYVVLAGW